MNPYLLGRAFHGEVILAGKEAGPGHAYLPFALDAIRMDRPLPFQV